MINLRVCSYMLRICNQLNDFVYFKTGLFRWLYEKFRYPFAPMYGGFPVKLRTYLGDPIPYDPKVTAEELAEKVNYSFFLSPLTDFFDFQYYIKN